MSEIIKYEPLESLPVQSIGDFFEMGKLIAQCNMLGVKNPAEGFIVATTCHQKRMSFLEFGETYHLIGGNLSMRADAMLARLLQFGGEYEILERSENAASLRAEFGKAKSVFSFTWEEAQKERFPYGKDGKTLKDNWSTPRGRKQMLWARCVSDAVRTVCPLANKGTYTPEEVRDFTDSPTITVETIVDPEVLKPKSKAKPVYAAPQEPQYTTINQPITDCPPNLDAIANMPAQVMQAAATASIPVQAPVPAPEPAEIQVQAVPEAESPFVETESDTNPAICPIGAAQKLAGKPWVNLPIHNLEFAIANWEALKQAEPGKLTDAHKVEIVKAIKAKNEAK